MKLYLTIIFGCSLLISAVLALCMEINFLTVLGLTALAVVLEIAIDGLTATVARLLPKRFADYTKKCFVVSAKEKKIYEKWKIRLWKDKIPEIGHFTGFRKNKLADPKSAEYVERFLYESCYGELGHFWAIFTGFFILLLFPISRGWMALAIPVAIVNAFLSILPIFVLRYNSYKLSILYNSIIKKEKRAEK